jgi:hypothetical protein
MTHLHHRVWSPLALSLLVLAVAAPARAQLEGRTRGDGYAPGSRGSARYYPDDDYQPNRWQLGVKVKNLDTGVQLTSVNRHSVAERNGLDAGDVIISVAGYQVGYVDRRLYDLSDEIARNVDRQGRVTLLVLRNRDNRLINNLLDFNLGPAEPGIGPDEGHTHHVAIRGEIAGRGGARLSNRAVQIARILDVTHPSWKNVVVSRAVERSPGQFPLNFGIAFDGRHGHKYAVDAIIYDGDMQYQTDRIAFDASTDRNATVKLRVVSESPIYDPTSWYRSNLRRVPTVRELAAWREQMEQGYSQDEIEAQILAGSEFYDRNGGGNPGDYVRGVTRAAAGRDPSPEELRRYSDQLQQPGVNRSSIVEQMLEAIRKRQ